MHSNFVIISCWILFLAYWIVSARSVKAIATQKSRQSSLAYRIPLIFGLILLWGQRMPGSLSQRLTPGTFLARLAADMICAGGLIIAIWARRTLAGNWSSDVTFKQGHELVKTGPYRFVRHPIYTGLLLMCVGSAMHTGQLHGWLGVLFIGVGFWIKLQQEEELMLQHFPDEYPAYRKQVKALVPFLI